MAATPEIVPWKVDPDASVVRRWPRVGTRSFVPGETLDVPAGRSAVFLRGEIAADGLAAGSHTLSPSTLPRITATRSAHAGAEPFDAAVLYFPTDWQEGRWGTRYPVAFRDNMFGVLRLRACGTYRVRFANPPLFTNTVVVPGERAGIFESEALIRDLISSRLADFLSDRVDTVMDLTRYIHDAPTEIGRRLAADFRSRGLELGAFTIRTVTVPDDVMMTLEARSGIGAVKGVVEFLRAQTGASLRDDADTVAPPAIAPFGSDEFEVDAAPLSPTSWGARAFDIVEQSTCPACRQSLPATAHACPHCSHQLYVRHRCPECEAENPADWRFCVNCGKQRELGWGCPSCATDIPVGSRFCMACGNQVAPD
jgi:membrane protease subunit (stomatin/prohibitin family)